MSAIDVSQYLIQYGLAGVVIFIFYRLVSNELKELKQAIERLIDKIDALAEKLK